MPLPDVIFAFDKLVTECLLCAIFYAGLHVKIKDHTAAVKELKVSWVDKQMVRW